MGQRIIAIDTETTGLHAWLGDRPFLFTFCEESGESWFVEFMVDPATREVDYNSNSAGKKKVAGILGDPNIRKVFFNAKFDVRMCEMAGFDVRGPVEEVAFMAKVCRSDEPSYGLKRLAKKYGDFGTEDVDSLKKAVRSLKTAAGKLGYKVREEVEQDYWLVQYAEEILVERLTETRAFPSMKPETKKRKLEEERSHARSIRSLTVEYGVLDSERTMFLYIFYGGIMDELGVRKAYEKEMLLWPHTYAMESYGVHIDLDQARIGRDDASRKRDKALKSLRSMSWPEFNPSSYKDKLNLFIHKFGLEPLSYTDSGGAQVDKYFLEHYEDECPAAKLLQEFSRADRAVSMYYAAYLKFHRDCIIHASFDQVGAKTLRFSCRDPNFQNVPKRAEPGDVMLEVRRCIGPRPGNVWYMGDYSQIEARLFADKASEETMLEAFAAGRDVYEELASTVQQLTGIELKRRDAKDIFLGKIYGLGKTKLLRKLSASGDTDEDGAIAVLAAFEEAFPLVRDYQQSVISEVKQNGCVTNRYGQRIDVDPDEAYKGINYLIQSEAAQLMKRAMIRCSQFLMDKFPSGHLVMTIHDELVFEFPANNRPMWVLRKLKSLMEDNEGMFTVSTPVEFSKTTGSWLDKIECKWR